MKTDKRKDSLHWRQTLAASLSFCYFFLPHTLLSHELWLAPQSYYEKSQTPLHTDIRIGQNFIGDVLRYRKSTIKTLTLLTDTGMMAINGRLGDQPAIQAHAPLKGQNILIYQSQPEKIIYQQFEKFAEFLQEKTDGGLLKQHIQRNLPRKDFTESYTRFAKTILVRGIDAPGITDRYSGMEVEFVLTGAPLHKRRKGALPIRLFYQGTPLPEAKITIFRKDRDQKISQQIQLSDKEGYIFLTPVSGSEYLIDHVVVREASPATNPFGAVWESLWASLTFKIL